ncbi:hypothetical protein QLX08_008354 [Tetragonisca angustula]|uniref:Uncharacterized protein n=1 Tax=Tetragonisca angustula TaxID=166442 RepID=A0AAW0ZLZ7_9HYME
MRGWRKRRDEERGNAFRNAGKAQLSLRDDRNTTRVDWECSSEAIYLGSGSRSGVSSQPASEVASLRQPPPSADYQGLLLFDVAPTICSAYRPPSRIFTEKFCSRQNFFFRDS